MTRLLHIEASPRKVRSHSIKVAKAFLDAYRQAHAGAEVKTLDVWSMELPEFNNEVLDAKYNIMHGQGHNAEEAAAWGRVEAIFEEFQAADHYLFSLPMWNFGLPYKLKHFLDIILQPGLAFAFNPETGYSGLLTGRPAVIVASRGGEYSSSPALAAYDMQVPYLEGLLRFMGFTDIRTIKVEPTLQGGPEGAEAALAAAVAAARAVAQKM